VVNNEYYSQSSDIDDSFERNYKTIMNKYKDFEFGRSLNDNKWIKLYIRPFFST
jgi:hypothetical protein